MLQVSLMKGVVRFGKRGKLRPRFIRPYGIVERVEKVSYRVALPYEWYNVHGVFHISQIKQYVANRSHMLDPKALEFDDSLYYKGRPVQILDKSVKSTTKHDIMKYKVLWATIWET